MRRPLYLFFPLLLCIALIISCSSCGQQPVQPKPKPEKPLRLLWSYGFPKAAKANVVAGRPSLTKGSVITVLGRTYSSLSQKDGSINWKHPLPKSGLDFSNQLTYDNQYLYGKTDRDSTCFAIDLADGEIVWKKKNTVGAFFDYTHDGVDGQNVYFAGDDSVIYVYKKSSGQYVDSISLESYARAITPKGNALFVSEAWKPHGAKNARGRIIRLNSTTHNTEWVYKTNKGGYYETNLIIKNGVVYSGTDTPGEFVALNAKTGKVKWKQSGVMSSRFILADDTLFVSSDAAVEALDAKTGRKLWSHDFGSSGGSNLAYLNGYLYHAHGHGLYIFNAKTGKIVAGSINAPDGDDFYNANAANGRVFIETNYHLYAYKEYGGGK